MMGYTRLCDMCRIGPAVIFNHRRDDAHCEGCYPVHLQQRMNGRYLDRVPTYKAPEVWVIEADYGMYESTAVVAILDYEPTREEAWRVGQASEHNHATDYTVNKFEVKRRGQQ